MKVEMTIDAHQLDDSVVRVFDSLSSEQRIQLALTVLKEWFYDPKGTEDTNAHEEALNYAKEQQKSRSSYSYSSDSELIRTHWYRDKMDKYRKTRDGMVAMVREEMTTFFKQEVKEMVQTDEAIKKAKEEMIEDLKGKFPGMVQETMTQWFATHLHEIACRHPLGQDQNQYPAY